MYIFFFSPLFFTSREFFSFYFSLLFSYPPPPSFYLLLIASDSKLPSNNAAMRAAMILPALGSSDKCYGNFPMEHGERCGFSPGQERCWFRNPQHFLQAIKLLFKLILCVILYYFNLNFLHFHSKDSAVNHFG